MDFNAVKSGLKAFKYDGATPLIMYMASLVVAQKLICLQDLGFN
jgi:hypothetical protein